MLKRGYSRGGIFFLWIEKGLHGSDRQRKVSLILCFGNCCIWSIPLTSSAVTVVQKSDSTHPSSRVPAFAGSAIQVRKTRENVDQMYHSLQATKTLFAPRSISVTNALRGRHVENSLWKLLGCCWNMSVYDICSTRMSVSCLDFKFL